MTDFKGQARPHLFSYIYIYMNMIYEYSHTYDSIICSLPCISRLKKEDKNVHSSNGGHIAIETGKPVLSLEY